MLLQNPKRLRCDDVLGCDVTIGGEVTAVKLRAKAKAAGWTHHRVLGTDACPAHARHTPRVNPTPYGRTSQ
jgi:uncharacterized NAD-dependent epimerase/dehydratase family protein